MFIVDDERIVRAALRSLLSSSSEVEVVGDSGDAREAVEQVREVRPDVVLLDIAMEGLSGIDAIPSFRKACPSARIVMLSHHEGMSFVGEALKAGANGYLSKDSDPSEPLLAIRSVREGRVYLSPKVAGAVVDQWRTPSEQPAESTAPASPLQALTAREREVFQLLALGKANKEVAKQLGISLGTAKKHRENVQRKLGCQSAAEMTRIAIREGLLSA